MKLIRLLLLIILMFFSLFAYSEPACEVYNVQIQTTNQVTKLCNTQYTSYYNSNFRIPELVVEILEPSDFAKVYHRNGVFTPDPRVINSPKSSDYNKSGFDRGHMSAASNTTSSKLIQESFLMTNIAPQSPTLNRGFWKTLESNAKAKGHNSRVLVISGVYFNNCLTPKRFNGIAIPDGFWKIIQIDGQYPQVWKFPNSRIIPGKLEDYQISIDQIHETCNVKFNLSQ